MVSGGSLNNSGGYGPIDIRPQQIIAPAVVQEAEEQVDSGDSEAAPALIREGDTRLDGFSSRETIQRERSLSTPTNLNPRVQAQLASSVQQAMPSIANPSAQPESRPSRSKSNSDGAKTAAGLIRGDAGAIETQRSQMGLVTPDSAQELYNQLAVEPSASRAFAHDQMLVRNKNSDPAEKKAPPAPAFAPATPSAGEQARVYVSALNTAAMAPWDGPVLLAA